MTAPRLRETEASVQKKIKQLAGILGFRLLCDSSQGYRPGGPRHGTTRITKGFPDLLFGHPERQVLVFVEVKGPNGELSADQRAWHARAAACGARVWTCRSAAEFQAYAETYGIER